MCRFALYMGPSITLDLLTTQPQNSIIHQSFKSQMREEPLNGDGFGLAWYVPDVSSQPALFRSIQPAWNNMNLRHLARVTHSSVILAHVRAATMGLGVSEENCHPFTVDSFAFMHNGSIAGFTQLKRRLQQRLSDEAFLSIKGTTDSEHVFALFRDNLSRLTGNNSTEMMATALATTISEVVTLVRDSGVTEQSFLNLAVTDGVSAVVSRFATKNENAPSLYYREASKCICEDGVCRMVDNSESSHAILVASEPLTEEPGWHAIANQQIVLIDADHCLSVRPLS